LGIIEVSWNGDNGMSNVVPQVVLGDALHLGQDHGGHFLCSQFFDFSGHHTKDGRRSVMDNLSHDILFVLKNYTKTPKKSAKLAKSRCRNLPH
jgi:hypothetical protein